MTKPNARQPRTPASSPGAGRPCSATLASGRRRPSPLSPLGPGAGGPSSSRPTRADAVAELLALAQADELERARMSLARVVTWRTAAIARLRARRAERLERLERELALRAARRARGQR